jgi:hypothetical protein
LIAAWLCYVAVYDRRTCLIPWWTTFPVILAACLGFALTGAWAPLAVSLICFLWDTPRTDLKRLLRRPPTVQAETRSLLPLPLAVAGTVGAVLAAHGQGEAAFVLAVTYAFAHAVWFVDRLPGGDAALLIAVVGVLPGFHFLWLATGVILAAVLPELIWRYRADLGPALRASLTGGPRCGLALLAAAATEKARPRPAAYLFALAGIVGLVVL